ncbi:MAG: hypothetical protein R3338_12020, partial [Thermoanaerobaculia bacterium]|nr:hypothetical protein [Thermoanaerobaculia bacterium]
MKKAFGLIAIAILLSVAGCGGEEPENDEAAVVTETIDPVEAELEPTDTHLDDVDVSTETGTIVD